MIADHNERLRRCCTGREITIVLSEADENRLRMWIDRMNADEERAGWTGALRHAQDPDDDDTLATALMVCADAGLNLDESEHGLESMPWGELVSVEQADEMWRRGE